jgi:hypothetical protein
MFSGLATACEKHSVKKYDFIAIPDADVPQAVEPTFQHVLTTYASETKKTVSVGHRAAAGRGTAATGREAGRPDVHRQVALAGQQAVAAVGQAAGLFQLQVACSRS